MDYKAGADKQMDKEIRMEAVRKLLTTIPHEDADREGLLGTPDRVARMYEEIFGGYEAEIDPLFKAQFKTDNNQMVIVKDINYWSHCEHHMVPFFGKIHIGYIPDGTVLGLSKFGRLVEVFARRLQIQEQLTFQLADEIDKRLKPKGLAIVVTGKHLCMAMRGIKKETSITVTNEMRGVFMEDKATRQEFFNTIHNTLR